VTGSVAGSLVSSTLYNQLGSINQINLGNNLQTNYSYWGIDHSTTTSYGKLWEIKTQPQAGGAAIQDLQYTWDNNSNLTQRVNTVSSETENFTYDSLDRLTGATGTSTQSSGNSGTISILMSGTATPASSVNVTVLMSGSSSQGYTQSYSYNTIGNITAMNGTSYTYNTNGTRPHAVTATGTTSYAYDANGNMTTRGTQTITWDVENRPLTVTGGTSLVYDGDGNRIEQIAGGQTTLYINQYYDKNLTTGAVTTYYYLGGQLVAQKTGRSLKYIHSDSLGSTSVMTTSTGAVDSSISYFPFGTAKSGIVSTAKEFTGQRLDSTGLYYYNARYYDPQIGRFISADNNVSQPFNPQNLNRYSYCLNNPLKYTNPSGNDQVITDIGENDNGETMYSISDGQGNLLAIATGIDDLAQKMNDCDSVSRGVDLPLGQAAADYINNEGQSTGGQTTIPTPVTPQPDLPSNTFGNNVAQALTSLPTASSSISSVSTPVNNSNKQEVHTGWGWFLFKAFETVDLQIPTGLVVSSCLLGTAACPVAGIILVPAAAGAIWCDIIIVKNEWKDFKW
jgi:RHS repeat-associated protein